MPLLAAFAVPHPPTLPAEMLRQGATTMAQTAAAFATVAQRVRSLQPDVIILASPHTTLYADYFHISPGTQAKGDLTRFGVPDISLSVEYDTHLATRLEKAAREWALPAGMIGDQDVRLDHGALVPLWVLRQAGVQCKVLRIGLSGLSALAHYQVGQCIAATVQALDRRAVFIASGDLSHKLSQDSPYGFTTEGKKFDQQIIAALENADFGALLTVSPALAESAAECGMRAMQMMAGVLDRKAVKPYLLSYEAPHGIGYVVAAFSVRGDDASRAFGDAQIKAHREALIKTKANEDALVRLARASLETFVRTGKRIGVPAGTPPELLHVRSGVFVTLKKDGLLRGCIGTTEPVAESIAAEAMRNAIAAATNDPRYDPVHEDELDELTYTVDVLTSPERIHSEASLDPARYGVIVQNGARRGLLLPNMDGVDSPARQIELARHKAGVNPKEAVRLYRFEVTRHQ